MGTDPTRSACLRGQDGAAAVEFALVLPLLIVLIFGILQFGILFAQDLALSNGAQRGARAAAVPTNDCDEIVARVRDGAQSLMLPADDPALEIRVYLSTEQGGPADACADPGRYPCEDEPVSTQVIVQVSRPASLQVPALGRNVTLWAEGRARCEFA